MKQQGAGSGPHNLGEHGIHHPGRVFWNLPPVTLVEQAVIRGEGVLTGSGALAVRTGRFTGRSPRDKYVVREEGSESRVNWGPVNQPLSPDDFSRLKARLLAYLQGRDLFVQDCHAGADSQYRLRVRVINEIAWHNLFARQLFIPAEETEGGRDAEFTVISAPRFHADPEADGTGGDAFIALSFTERLVLIGGTAYAGEIKKSIFTVMNFLLPERGVFPMHCSANMGPRGDVALFFGLSGTGKTTLSADPARRLIGDDEHGWSDQGVFNFEGGCYAKCIRLSPEQEPQIWNAIRFGSVVENVIYDERRRLDFADETLTENTRAAYPVDYIHNAVIPGVGGHPRDVFFLTADAFGVLPPISRLTVPQARYHFLAGYTAKVAGTEAGLGSEPQATFSTCFALPFLPLRPTIYSQMLGDKLEHHRVRVWLVNTGWTGGPYGVGRRMHLPYTRAMITAALSGALDEVAYREEPVFGLRIPRECPGVPAELLDPRSTWEDRAAYDAQARDLAGRFIRNFQQFPEAPEVVRDAGPRLELLTGMPQPG